jgi:hypothetical protein
MAACLLGALSASALADPGSQFKWRQPPDPAYPKNVFYGWNELSDWWYGPVVADDWVCTTPDPVTDIHWWGSFPGWKYADPPQLPDHFHIQFWTDVPAGSGDPPTPFSHPGRVIHEIVCYNYQWEFAGWDYDPRTREYEACFKFEQVLTPAEYFYQDPGPGGQNIYWISIAACEGGPPPLHPWGWKTRPRDANSPAPDDAVIIWDPVQPTLGSQYVAGTPIWWPTPEDSWDMAFELTTRREDWKWMSWPDTLPTGIDVNATASPLGGPQFLLADDFLCTQSGPIQMIYVWGSWRRDQYPLGDPGAVDFTLSLHLDNPAGPGGFSEPGPLLWMRDFHPGEFQFLQWAANLQEGWLDPPDAYVPFGDTVCWLYEFPLMPGEFYQEGSPDFPVIYWLDVQARPHESGTKFGWKTSETQWHDDAVWTQGTEPPVEPWRELHYPPGHPWAGNSLDLAFAITGAIEGKKWSQPPQRWIPDDAYNGWDEFSVYGEWQIVADDWVCQTQAPVTDIHWWGSFIDWYHPYAPTVMPAAFHIAFWTDVPANPADPGSFSHPGQVIWETYCDNFTCEFVGWDFDPRIPRRGPMDPPEATFKFTQNLPPDQWFWQDPDVNIYWISIAAVYHKQAPLYPFGWKTRPRDPSSPAPDDGVLIWDPTAPVLGAVYVMGGPIWYPTPEDSWDLAFELTSEVFDLDFGDAPDPPYPTLLGSNGARHAIWPGIFLGAGIDGEFDGQPVPPGWGDDLNGIDDEDGVTFMTPLIPGTMAQVDVIASVPGFLWAWIDFSGDGNWAQPNDRIFAGQGLAPGLNSLSFLVPASAQPGTITYARFRFTTAYMVLPFDGFAPDGEVEDYEVFIEPEPQFEYRVEFSVDIGSDAELSDPFVNGNEGFDPGDAYWWQGPPVTPPLVPGGRDGFKDDMFLFAGVDIWPDPPDPAIPPATRVPVGQGGPPDYWRYFDLDGHDQLDASLFDLGLHGQPLQQPLPMWFTHCVFPPKYLLVSFDDDMGPGWPVSDVPVTVPSPAGRTYGTTAGRDEVMCMMLMPTLPPAPMPIVYVYRFADEVQVHQSLAPNPDFTPAADDDVDSLDVVQDRSSCPFWYFTADHEATGTDPMTGAVLDPGDIYEVTPGGPVRVIDDVNNLGIPDSTDVDAFEFTYLELPGGGPVLVILFSVDDDDPLTAWDESGGLDPRMIYASLLTGYSFPALDRPLWDDIDAIAIWRDSLRPLCLGDLNCDGQVDFGDINPFVLRLSNPAGYFATFIGCPNGNGDINGNGSVGFDDINPFVALLSNNPLPIPCP